MSRRTPTAVLIENSLLLAPAAGSSPMPKDQKVCPGNNKKCGHPNGTNAKTCAKCKNDLSSDMNTREKCEGCQLKVPNFGLPGEGKKRRWCSGCAKG